MLTVRFRHAAAIGRQLKWIAFAAAVWFPLVALKSRVRDLVAVADPALTVSIIVLVDSTPWSAGGGLVSLVATGMALCCSPMRDRLQTLGQPPGLQQPRESVCPLRCR